MSNGSGAFLGRGIAASWLTLLALAGWADAAPLAVRADGAVVEPSHLLGATGLEAIDLRGDGIPELLVGMATGVLLVELDPVASGWRPLWEYQVDSVGVSSERLVRARLGDLDGDGAREAVLVTMDGRILVLDVATGTVMHETGTGRAFADMVLANLDGVAGDEIVACDDDALTVFRAREPVPDWTLAERYCMGLTVGQMDPDLPLEVAMVRRMGLPGLVVDTGSRGVEWTAPLTFMDRCVAGDVDADGFAELACVGRFRAARMFDVDARTLSWQSPGTPPDFLDDCQSVWLGDLDADGIADLLAGAVQGARLCRADPRTGAADRPVLLSSPAGVWGFSVADFDGDGLTDVALGLGSGVVPGQDPLAFLSCGLEPHWESNWSHENLVESLALADFDADGRTELFHSTSTSDGGWGPPWASLLDLHRRLVKWGPEAIAGGNPLTTRGVAVVQADADAALEVVVQDSAAWTIGLACVDAATRERQWTTIPFDGEEEASLAAGDLDGDGVAEVILGTKRHGSTSGMGPHVRQVDAATGSVEWTSPVLAPGIDEEATVVRAANVDADPQQEILAVVSTVGVLAWDGLSHVEEWRLVAADATAMETADVDGDGRVEVLVGTRSGRLSCHDRRTGTVCWDEAVSTHGVNAVRVADLDDDGAAEIILAAGTFNGWTLRVLDARDRSVRWESERLFSVAGASDCLVVGDADDDGAVELLVASSGTVRVFEVVRGTVDILPPSTPSTVQALPSDVSACVPSVDVLWGPATDEASPPMSYELHRSFVAGFTPSLATLLVTTPWLSHRDVRVAAGARLHYRVIARDAAGNASPASPEASIDVEPAAPPAPVVTSLERLEPCVPAQVLVRFDHEGFDCDAGELRLFVDGVDRGVVASGDVVSLPDVGEHSFVIVATDGRCGSVATSAAVVGPPSALPAAAILRLEDPDPCTANQVRVHVTHPGFASTGHHELWLDGAPWIADVSDGDVVSWPGGAHRASLVSVDDCGATPSLPVLHADRADCSPGEPDIRLSRDALATWVAWALVPDAVRFDTYVGMLSSLGGGSRYDHVPGRAGLDFPDAPDTSLGCDATVAGTDRVRVAGLAHGDYVLVTAVSASGVRSSFGRDSFLRERRALDPRPDTTWCP